MERKKITYLERSIVHLVGPDLQEAEGLGARLAKAWSAGFARGECDRILDMERATQIGVGGAEECHGGRFGGKGHVHRACVVGDEKCHFFQQRSESGEVELTCDGNCAGDFGGDIEEEQRFRAVSADKDLAAKVLDKFTAHFNEAFGRPLFEAIFRSWMEAHNGDMLGDAVHFEETAGGSLFFFAGHHFEAVVGDVGP